MAQTMRDSVQRAALSQITREMDLTAVQAVRRALASSVSLNVFLLAAVARTLPHHPLLNAELVDDKVLVYEPVNLGMAVAVPDGLIVAVIREAHRKTLAELAAAAEDIAARARSGKLGYADIEGGTFTVSNLGMYGIDTLLAIIQPNQSAILGIGAVAPKPVVRDGEIVVRRMMTLGLSADHRATDGAQGAEFLQTLRDLLEPPVRLLQ